MKHQKLNIAKVRDMGQTRRMYINLLRQLEVDDKMIEEINELLQ